MGAFNLPYGTTPELIKILNYGHSAPENSPESVHFLSGFHPLDHRDSPIFERPQKRLALAERENFPQRDSQRDHISHTVER